MVLESKLSIIHAALWCYDFENTPPPDDDKQKVYLYAFTTLFKKNRKGIDSKNMFERFKARKNLIALIELWDRTIKTTTTSNNHIVISEITFPNDSEFSKFLAVAKHERESALERELSQKLDETKLNNKIKEMKIVFENKAFGRLSPGVYESEKSYLYAFYLLMQKNEQYLNSPEKIERLQAKKNISILVALWEKTVPTYSITHPRTGKSVVIIGYIDLPEKEHYDKIMSAANDWKEKQKAELTISQKTPSHTLSETKTKVK